MNEYLSMFIDETREHLQAWSDGMLTLEKHADAETIATIFRAAHTIKGMAMTMGFTRMGEVT
ncbi:Hpt domain-containing protein, partial [Sulfoacidibacillus thermotolerans]